MSEEQLELKRIMRDLSRRLNWAVWLNSALKPLIVVLTGFGSVLLLLKMLLPEMWQYATIALIALPVALLWAYRSCRRRKLFFQPPELAEVIDHLYTNDGSVTAVYEKPALVPGEAFYDDLQRNVATRLPRIEPGFFMRRMLLALIYVAVAAIVPPRAPAVQQQKTDVLNALTTPLEEKLAENSQLIPEEEKAELAKNLEEIKKDEQQISKEQWEAVEEIEQRIENAVQEQENNASQMATSLNQLANAMSEQANDSTNLGGDPKQQAEIDKIIQDLSVKGKNPKMPLNAKQREGLLKALSQCKAGKFDSNCSGSLCKLAGELAGMCKGNGPGKNMPGRGGISRGRGDAALVFGEEKVVSEARFKEQQLENQFLASDDLVDLGVIPVAPKPDPGRFAPGTLREFGDQQGSNVSRTQISPSQKDVVSRYFNQ